MFPSSYNVIYVQVMLIILIRLRKILNMALAKSFPLFSVFFVMAICMTCAHLAMCSQASSQDQKLYIVYMGELPQEEDYLPSSHHANLLEEVTGSYAENSLLRSFSRSFNGFVAKLTDDERQQLSSKEGVISVFPRGVKTIHTTRSWDFVDFPENVERNAFESDVIVGLFDHGIWPESESFSDKGLGPPPKKWKGTCQTVNFTCNNKIIGARYYRHNHTLPEGDMLSPRDTNGHGTHTASTAAGASVANASLFDLGMGTARGGVPSARIAVYKTCWDDGCSDEDILSAFDDAIADGVDILSISLGANSALNYYEDVLAIGSFHAMKKGILTSISAGNDGPDPASITNVAPWLLSVGATVTDRKFVNKVQLGNGMEYEGVTINTFQTMNQPVPIIYGGNAPNISKGANATEARNCYQRTLDEKRVKGKIVFCDSMNSGLGPLAAGAIGDIMLDDNYKDNAYAFPISTIVLSSKDGAEISKYLNSTSQPVGSIQKSKEAKDMYAPYVVSFSSRGPSNITSNILKPDIVAPGTEILAAWSLSNTVTGLNKDTRHVPYNIISGTSMSCPHVTGIAAYVKSHHPDWSPAAIKSALMTTATPLNSSYNYDAEFAYGSGQMNPLRALDPGLVYDAQEIDYVKFLCGQVDYSTTSVRLVTGELTSCSDYVNETVWDLNYPSFALTIPTRTAKQQLFRRTVTNLGTQKSTYKAIVDAAQGLEIQVEPDTLTFVSTMEKKSFNVTVTAQLGVYSILSGSLVWDDGVHKVRSPVVAFSM